MLWFYTIKSLFSIGSTWFLISLTKYIAPFLILVYLIWRLNLDGPRGTQGDACIWWGIKNSIEVYFFNLIGDTYFVTHGLLINWFRSLGISSLSSFSISLCLVSPPSLLGFLFCGPYSSPSIYTLVWRYSACCFCHICAPTVFFSYSLFFNSTTGSQLSRLAILSHSRFGA